MRKALMPLTETLSLYPDAHAGHLPPPAVEDGWGGGATLTRPRALFAAVPLTLSLPHAGGGKRLGQPSRVVIGGRA